ncbi:MAG: LacI family DNA-binding transcriptional regulator [Actinomycetota bacterium]
MTPRRPVTIDDVARTAGVSVATVSRALRGLPNVAPATRLRVEEIAAKLSYRPDPSATRLASGRSRTVAMAVPHLGSWYFSQVMAGAERVLTEAGYDVQLFTTETVRARSGQLPIAPIAQRAEGLILVNIGLPDAELDSLTSVGPAIVGVGGTAGPFASVRVDDVAVAELAVDHLLGLGHRRIALFELLNDAPIHFDVPDERRRGYHNALRRAGIEPETALELVAHGSVEGGRVTMAYLLAQPDPPSAIFAMSDEIASGALQTIRERGLRVPEDFSIIGVDDHEFSAVLGLTTVQQDVTQHGVMAARLLLDEMEQTQRGHKPEPVRYNVPIALRKRTTTAPFR